MTAGWESERAGFHEERRTIIGSSDAAAIMGLARWGTAMDVWAEKVGMLEPSELGLRQWIGLRLETLIAEMAAARLGRSFRRMPTHLINGRPTRMVVSRQYPYIGAHLDFVQLEVKTSYSAEGYGDDGATIDPADRDSWDAVPIDYLLQVQHQLYVTGWPRITLAVLIGHDDFRTFDVPPIPSLIVPLVAEEVRFWMEHVVTGDPPPLDASEGTRAYLRARFPRALGDLRTATPEETLLIDEARQTAAALKAADAAHELSKSRIEAVIGHDLGLRAPGVTVTWPEIERKPEIAWALVAQSYRALLDALAAGRGWRVALKRAGLPPDLSPERLDALVGLYTAPREPYRRINFAYSRRKE